MTGLAVWVATLGPVGHWPLGPGTLASALVAVLWWAIPDPGWSWLLALAILTPLGIGCADRAETRLGTDDGRIVIDEVVGMGVALLPAPHTALGAVVAFGLFRLFDITKPPPLGRLQDVRGGWGVVLDDLAAGAVAALLVAAGTAVVG